MTPAARVDLAQTLRRAADLLEAISLELDTVQEPRGSQVRRLLPYADAAAYLGISVRGFKALVAAGNIVKVPIGARVLFDRDDLDAYIEGIKRGGAPGR